jgi:hypothetical protein
MPQSAIPPGRHAPVRPDWMNKRREEALEPDLPIVASLLWDRPGNRYLFQDPLEELGSGHNIVATCFEECREMYRVDGAYHPEQNGVGDVGDFIGETADQVSCFTLLSLHEATGEVRIRFGQSTTGGAEGQ